MVKGTQYEVLSVIEEARTSIKPHIKSYTAVFLRRADDNSEDPSLVLELRGEDRYMITMDKKRTMLKEGEFKVIS
jgi:uncharacterized Zn finger protein